MVLVESEVGDVDSLVVALMSHVFSASMSLTYSSVRYPLYVLLSFEMPTSSVEESLNSKLALPYFVELNS